MRGIGTFLNIFLIKKCLLSLLFPAKGGWEFFFKQGERMLTLSISDKCNNEAVFVWGEWETFSIS